MPTFAPMNVSECCSWHSKAPLARHPEVTAASVNSSRDTVLLFRLAVFCKGRVTINCNSSKNLHYFLIILYCSHLGLSPVSATRFLKANMAKPKSYITKLGYSLPRTFCNLQEILQASVVEYLHHRVTSSPKRRPLIPLRHL